MKLSELTNFKLIGLLESATELFRNKKYHPRDYVQKYLGLSLQRSSFYGTIKNGQYIAHPRNLTSFDTEEDSLIVVEGILQLERLPINIGAGEIVYSGYGVLEVGGVVIYDGRGGAAGLLFNNDIPVVLADGKNLGRFLNGDTILAIGKTAEEVITDIAIEYLAPAFTSFSMGLTGTVEVGTSFTGLTNSTWSTTQPGNVAVDSIGITDVTNSAILAFPLSNDGSESVDLQGPIAKTTETSNTWQIALANTLAGTATRNVTTTWSYLQFYGVGTTPASSAQVRALGNQRFNTAGNSFTLNTGSVENVFNIALPPGKSISSVVDLDALNADITSEYINTGSVIVTLQEGETASYSIWVMSPAIAYSSNHRHAITL
jgi:hypothetical protein